MGLRGDSKDRKEVLSQADTLNSARLAGDC